MQEDLTPESIVKVLDDLAAGKQPKTGPLSERRGSEPNGPLTALTDIVRSSARSLEAGHSVLIRNVIVVRSRKTRSRTSWRSGGRCAEPGGNCGISLMLLGRESAMCAVELD